MAMTTELTNGHAIKSDMQHWERCITNCMEMSDEEVRSELRRLGVNPDEVEQEAQALWDRFQESHPK